MSDGIVEYNTQSVRTLKRMIENREWISFYKYIRGIDNNPNYIEETTREEFIELTFFMWSSLEGVGLYEGMDNAIYPIVESILSKCYHMYKKDYDSDEDLNWIMGYMISVLPEAFTKINDDYEDMRAYGEQLLDESLTNYPDNPMIVYLSKKTRQNKLIQSEAQVYIKDTLNGSKMVQQYFENILKTKK